MGALVFVVLAACGGSQASAPTPMIANATPIAAAPAPAPKSTMTLAPDKGDANGGTYVRIIGTGFLDNGSAAASLAKIYFGSVQGEIIRFTSDTEIIAQAPGGKPGETVDVLLILEGRGELKIPKAFTFVDKH